MPPKRKPTLTPNGNTLPTRLYNIVGFSVDKTAKSILADFELLPNLKIIRHL